MTKKNRPLIEFFTFLRKSISVFLCPLMQSSAKAISLGQMTSKTMIDNKKEAAMLRVDFKHKINM